MHKGEMTAGVIRNLRLLLWSKDVPREQWASVLGECIGSDERRGKEVLRNGGLQPHELASLVNWSGRKQTDLLERDLLHELRGQLTRLNLQHLRASLPHGDIARLAETLDVDRTTVSAWFNERREPTGEHRRRLLAYFGLPPDIKLDEVPLFLDDRPLGDGARRKWLHERIDRLHRDTLHELFPALERLLSAA